MYLFNQTRLLLSPDHPICNIMEYENNFLLLFTIYYKCIYNTDSSFPALIHRNMWAAGMVQERDR